MQDSFLNFQLKERWEDLKKNISINPQGNRVRFVPIIPNNNNQRINVLPTTSSKSMLFKPFKPNQINNCPSKENVNSTQHKNSDKEYQIVAPVTHMDTSVHPSRFSMNNQKFVGLQLSQKQQEVKKLNTLNSFVDMNELENSLPKFPLRTIWTNDNNSKDFGCSLATKPHTFKKPFPSNLNCLSNTKQSTNYMLNSKYQKQSQVIPTTTNKVNTSRYLKSSHPLSAYSGQNVHPIVDNLNTSFFSLDNEKLSAVSGQNVNALNSLGCTNQPFSMDDIWKDNQCQPPRM